MYTDNRDHYRKAFFVAWQKHQRGLALEAIERAIVDVIILHPAYHRFLSHEASLLKQEFVVEENPFFHMSLHIALREQFAFDRPQGITAIYQQWQLRGLSAHEAEHQMMQSMAKLLQESAATGAPPDDAHYLAKLKLGLELMVGSLGGGNAATD